MSEHQPLNNQVHKDVKVINQLGAEYGDLVSFSHVFPMEFALAQGDFPIVIKQSNNDSEALEFIALFGLEKDQNLFLNGHDWEADYLPLTMQRAPFLIGFEQTMENGVPTNNPVVHIDMSHPKVLQDTNQGKGEALFLEQGGNTEFLNQKNSVLQAILEGKEQADNLLNALKTHDLLEPLSISVTFDNGDQLNLSGLHTINEDKLFSLSAEATTTLQQSGMLKPIYMMLASLTNIKKLIARRNQQTPVF